MKILKLLSLALLTTVSAVIAQPTVSIQEIQFKSIQDLQNNDDLSSYDGDTIVVEGIVTFNPCAYGLSTSGSRVGTWISASGGGAWNSVHILIDPTAIGFTPNTVDALDAIVKFKDNFVIGNKIRATVRVSTFNGYTQLLCLPVESEVLSLGETIPGAETLPIDTFMKSDGQGGQIRQLVSGERWEASYVQFDNVQIVDVSLGSGASTGRVFWSVQDAQGNKIKIRDISGHFRNDTSDNFCTSAGSYTPNTFETPLVNSTIAYVRGIIAEHVPTGSPNEYYISPLDPSDLGPQISAAPVITNIQRSLPTTTTSQTQTITATITDADGTISSAVLKYAQGLASSTFTDIAMTNSGGTTWTATIPAISTDSTWVKFFITATDNNNNSTTGPNGLNYFNYYLVKNAGITKISDIQFNPLNGNDSPFRNAKLNGISITGVVMSTTQLTDLGLVYLQDGEDKWSGILLGAPGINTLQRGDKITITAAKVVENFSLTRLDSITYTLVNTSNPLYNPVMDLTFDSVATSQYNYTEPYESMLLKYNNMIVSNLNPDDPNNYGEWTITNTAGGLNLRCDDFSNDILPHGGFNLDSLTVGQNLQYIYGVLAYTFGNWKLLPRNKDDIAGYSTVYTSIASNTGNEALLNAYPNPFNQELNVIIEMKQPELATIRLFDINGKQINAINKQLGVGKNNMTYPTENLSKGIYFIKFTTETHSGIIKVVKN
jgi:hypothetical protein